MAVSFHGGFHFVVDCRWILIFVIDTKQKGVHCRVRASRRKLVSGKDPHHLHFFWFLDPIDDNQVMVQALYDWRSR